MLELWRGLGWCKIVVEANGFELRSSLVVWLCYCEVLMILDGNRQYGIAKAKIVFELLFNVFFRKGSGKGLLVWVWGVYRGG